MYDTLGILTLFVCPYFQAEIKKVFPKLEKFPIVLTPYQKFLLI